MVNSYYQDLFSRPSGNWEWVQTTLTYPSLDPDLLERLASPIENGEIKKSFIWYESLEGTRSGWLSSRFLSTRLEYCRK